MLEGQGVYRLDDEWYPVRAGRRHLDGAFLPAMVRRDGKDTRALPLLQGREPRSDGGTRVTGLRLEVEIDRLMTELDELAAHSDAPAPAVTRVVYSDSRPDSACVRQEAFSATLASRSARMRSATRSPAGRVERPGLPAVATGSHIDAIPHSGRFDGTVGVLGAIEAVRALKRAGFRAGPADRDPAVHQRRADAIRHRLPRQPGALRKSCRRAHSAASRIPRATRSTSFAAPRAFMASFRRSGSLREPFRGRSSSCTSSKARCSSASGTAIGIVTAIAAPAALRVTWEGEGGHAGAVLMPGRKGRAVRGGRNRARRGKRGSFRR